MNVVAAEETSPSHALDGADMSVHIQKKRGQLKGYQWP